MNICPPCPFSASTSENIANCTVQVFDSVLQLSESVWRRFVPEHHLLMQFSYLQMIEKEFASEMIQKYVVIQENGETLGVAAFQLLKFEASQLINYFPKGEGYVYQISKKATAAILNSIKANLLVCGNIFMTGEPGFYFAQGIDKVKRSELIRKAVNEVRRQSVQPIQAALFPGFYEPKSEFDNGFSADGYHELHVESDMAMPINRQWRTFEDYLNALSSKYRVRTKKVLSLCNENEVQTIDMSADDIKRNEQDLYRLYTRVMDNADFSLGRLVPTFFYEQKLNQTDAYRVIGYFKEGQLIGFISAYLINNKLEVHYTGMDHDMCRPIHLYQHMMYDMIKLAIENGMHQIHFGRTATEIKSTVGATPKPMYGYLKHFNPLVNATLVKGYTRSLRAKEYVIRNPFK